MARELADGVLLTGGTPALPLLNVYVLGADRAEGGVVLDSGVRASAGLLRRRLRPLRLSGHALTHAHGDHAGSSHVLREAFGLPLWVGRDDADAVEAGRLDAHAWTGWRALARTLLDVPAQPVDRRLVEGDEVGGFEVLECPGHSPGALAYWRERDRVLLAGDVLANLSPVPGRPVVVLPPVGLSADADANRASARRLADLRPRVVGFGHGLPVTDPGRFAAAVTRLL